MRTFDFGGGTVRISPDGAVAAVGHPRRDHSMLLEENSAGPEAAMHESSRRWGKGFVITGTGGHRFDRPARLDWTEQGVDLGYDLGDLELTVSRRIAETWTETYVLRNTSSTVTTVGSIAVSTPWRDVYGSSRESLHRAVHAHVWTGGADAWVWAVPMDGSGPGLGLQLIEGELWAYSVESRDPVTSSNVRGHLYLHVTDHARAAHAMGGQPEIVLAPGQTCRWSWRLDWYPDLAALHAARRPMVEAAAVAAEVGQPLPLMLAPGVTTDEPQPVTSATAGIRHVDVSAGDRRARVSLLFHPPLRSVVESRVRFVLDHHRQLERSDSRRAAFVPYDNDTGLTVLPGAWRDWSDLRERVGMALLLQGARDRGWCDADELTEALAAYERFVVEDVVDDDGTVGDEPSRQHPPRLYNFPWFARFLLGQGDLDRAVRIIDRYYALGGRHFLAFDLGLLLRDLAARLSAAGRGEDAVRMLGHLGGHARSFLEYGDELPPHEVNYEQSMVAPLLELLIAAYAAVPGAVPAGALLDRLPWLTAFAADQPDARLRHVPIRHWDGYWFGAERRWGDVFPHYWSVLSAGVYLSWPADIGDETLRSDLRAHGHAILRSNLVNFGIDGSATCAFVYPSCVNGRPAHVADPLANDQGLGIGLCAAVGAGMRVSMTGQRS